MSGWRKGVFWALPTHCNPVLCLSLFLSSPIPRSYSQLLPHRHMPTALKMERPGYWQVRCVVPQSLSPTPSSCFSLSLCSINTQHSDLRSSAASGTLRWASRFQQTLSSLTWAGAAHREKAKQPDADWSAPSSSSSAPSASFHTTFALLCHKTSTHLKPSPDKRCLIAPSHRLHQLGTHPSRTAWYISLAQLNCPIIY